MLGIVYFLKIRVSNGLGGRTPWKQPLTDPVTVKEVHGNKATVRLADGSELTDVHVENMLHAPDDAVNLEDQRVPIEFHDEESFLLDDISHHRSPGEMLEDDGNLRDAQVPDVKKSKADKVSAGTIVAYAIDKHTYSTVSYTHLTLPTKRIV